MAGIIADDQTPSMEEQAKGLRATAIAVTERQIELCKEELARLQANLRRIKDTRARP